MNEVLLDEELGREHVKELIRQADHERLVKRVSRSQHRKRWLTRVRNGLLKSMSAIIG